ncbi:cell division cycle-associated protein 2 [Tamandua tetradactyla]|uniref:cell division cycle-associated protein 2 n=1 Tax=Tamandua tetradactyla TaxID=48850 RepID=UPI004053F005
MDTNSKGKEPEIKESAIKSTEDTSFIFANGKLVTPQKHEAEVTSNFCTPDTFKSPLNFSTVTVEQLGITPESFVKDLSGKASSYLKKSRRRSTIGVRGSPETNHLICFIAQQRNLKRTEKSLLAQDSPFQGSPVLYQKVNSLKERISAFQSAFHSIEENEKMTDYPEFSEAEREVKLADSSTKKGLRECRQSGFPVKVSAKRRRISCQSNPPENLTDAERKVTDLHIFDINTSPSVDRTRAVETSADLSKKSFGPGLTESGCLVEESIPLSDLTEASNEEKGSSDAISQKTGLVYKFTEVSADTVHEVKSPGAPVCERSIQPSETFVPRSVLKKPSVKLLLESLQKHCDNLSEDGTHPSLISNFANSCREQEIEDQENSKVLPFQNVRKKKRVTFGEELSPEVFDESLPANTPLRKGETPVCKKDISNISPILLEKSPVPDQLLQPNFDDKGEDLENIEPLQVSFAVLSPPSNSSVSETSSGTDTFISSNNHEEISPSKAGRLTRTSKRRNQLISLAEESVCNLFNTDTHQCKEKKINRKKPQETKHMKRALPKKNQALKGYRKKKGKRKQNVQKSLYGSRDIASKKPLLSPIPEMPEISEMTPSVQSVQRMCSDDSSSNDKLKEVVVPPTKLIKRKNLLPQYSEDSRMNQDFDMCNVSEFCSTYVQSSSSLDNPTLDQGSNINATELYENEYIPKVENKLQSENELKTRTEDETNHISYAVVTVEPVLSDNPKSDFILPSQEFSATDQNVKSLCQILKTSKDISEGEKEDDNLAIEEELKSSHLMFDSQKEFNYLGDVLIKNKKETRSQSESLERKSAENSSVVSCKERKRRRYSIYCPDGQGMHLDKNRNHKPAYTASSSVQISLENSELYKDLSDSLEETFRRISSETKVRRSMRLQKDSENEGLVWISLPFPSTSCASQKIKRRTICTFDNTELENTSPSKKTVTCRQKPCLLPSVSGKENNEGSATHSSNLPEKRRKSFCISTLASTKNTTQSKYYKKRTSLSQKGERFLNDF